MLKSIMIIVFIPLLVGVDYIDNKELKENTELFEYEMDKLDILINNNK